MPLYVAECDNCGHRQDYFRKVAEVDDTPQCELCLSSTRNKIVPTMLAPNYVAFVSPLDGQVVDGRTAFKEHCKKHNVVPFQEVWGDNPQPKATKPEGIKEAVIEAVQRVEQGAM